MMATGSIPRAVLDDRRRHVPFDLALIEDLYDALRAVWVRQGSPDLIDDRRFAETILSRRPRDGIMDRNHLPDPPEDASLVAVGQRDYRYRERSLRLKPAQRARTPITLRQGARVIEDSRHLRLAWAEQR